MRIEDGRLSFFQWDINQRLLIDNEDIKEVHFSNAFTHFALVCEVFVENGKRLVNVPNILLQTEWTIKAYGWCDNCVKAAESYVVQPREKPEDYVYTETEVKRFDELEARITALEENKKEKYKYMGSYTISSAKQSQTITYVGGKAINYKKVLIVADVEGKYPAGSSVTSASLKIALHFDTMEELVITITGALYNEQSRKVYAECMGADELYKTVWSSSSTNSYRTLYTLTDLRVSDEAIKKIVISSGATSMNIASGSIFKFYAVEA